MTQKLAIGGSDVLVNGALIEYAPPAGSVTVAAQSAFVALFPPPTVTIVAQSAFVVMLHSAPRRRTGMLIA